MSHDGYDDTNWPEDEPTGESALRCEAHCRGSWPSREDLELSGGTASHVPHHSWPNLSRDTIINPRTSGIQHSDRPAHGYSGDCEAVARSGRTATLSQRSPRSTLPDYLEGSCTTSQRIRSGLSTYSGAER